MEEKSNKSRLLPSWRDSLDVSEGEVNEMEIDESLFTKTAGMVEAVCWMKQATCLFTWINDYDLSTSGVFFFFSIRYGLQNMIHTNSLQSSHLMPKGCTRLR